MRIKSAANDQGDQMEFAKYLLDIGEGKINNIVSSKYEDDIKLPDEIAKNMN